MDETHLQRARRLLKQDRWQATERMVLRSILSHLEEQAAAPPREVIQARPLETQTEGWTEAVKARETRFDRALKLAEELDAQEALLPPGTVSPTTEVPLVALATESTAAATRLSSPSVTVGEPIGPVGPGFECVHQWQQQGELGEYGSTLKLDLWWCHLCGALRQSGRILVPAAPTTTSTSAKLASPDYVELNIPIQEPAVTTSEASKSAESSRTYWPADRQREIREGGR